jgi:hypothetical protein
MSLVISRTAAEVLVALLVLAGVWVLCFGMPRARHYCLPWRWRVGVLYLGLGLMGWPLFYFFFGHADLEMGWIPIWFATILTFVVGIKRLLMSNRYEPGGSFSHPYDLGWIMRPRPARGSNPAPRDVIDDSIESIIEDQSNPLAPILRFHRRNPLRRKRETEGSDASPE